MRSCADILIKRRPPAVLKILLLSRASLLIDSVDVNKRVRISGSKSEDLGSIEALDS